MKKNKTRILVIIVLIISILTATLQIISLVPKKEETVVQPAKNYVTYTFTAGEGGTVYGELSQTVEVGSNLSQVYAEANTGYRFTGWSDGIAKNVRSDTNVKESKTITANFEEIMVYFYSESTLVRSYSLNDLATADLDSIVGYKSFNDFKYWNFYKTSNSLFGDSTDALDKIMNLYSLDYKFTNDIYCEAVYEENVSATAFDSRIVMHAGGGYNGSTYTNSLEAFNYWYNKGQRFFEFDIGMTTDGYFLTVHRQYNKSMAEFKAEYVARGLTIMELSDLVSLINSYTDCCFDFDVLTIYEDDPTNNSTNYDTFYSTLKGYIDSYGASSDFIWDRIILEVLPQNDVNMLTPAKAYGFKHFLYAEYFGSSNPISATTDFENVMKYCNNNGIEYLSIGWFNSSYGQLAKTYGVKCFTFTFDDINKIYEFLDMGASGVFSNFVFL